MYEIKVQSEAKKTLSPIR